MKNCPFFKDECTQKLNCKFYQSGKSEKCLLILGVDKLEDLGTKLDDIEMKLMYIESNTSSIESNTDNLDAIFNK